MYFLIKMLLSGFLIYSFQSNKNQDLTCKAGILRITSWTNSFLHSREKLL